MSLSLDQIAYMQAHASDNKDTEIIIANAICITATLAAVLLRLWVRRLTDAGLGMDDWCIIVGWVSHVQQHIH